MRKKGQITIFIIIAIIIVATIVLFFILTRGVIPEIGGGDEEINIASFLDTCLKDKILQGIRIISLQGGSINPSPHIRFKFEGENYRNISYLCYNQNDYLPCINQQPLLIRHLKNEIKDYISEEVEFCFNEFVFSLENKGYEVDAGYSGFQIDLMSKKVIVEIDAEIATTKADETSRQEDFEIIVPSRLYDLSFIVQEIVTAKTLTCNFDYNTYTFLYPSSDIDLTRAEDSEIYTIENKNTREKFRFAIRGCVIPPGF